VIKEANQEVLVRPTPVANSVLVDHTSKAGTSQTKKRRIAPTTIIAAPLVTDDFERCALKACRNFVFIYYLAIF
jgi:hypothetical protein